MGAKTAKPEKLVIAVIGEEALCETAMDIETSIRCHRPILFVVVNNRAFADRDGGSSPKLANNRFSTKMDICELAKALGAVGIKVESPSNLADGLTRGIISVNSGTTAIVEILTTRVKTSLHHLFAEPLDA